jgi:hypothetical protein
MIQIVKEPLDVHIQNPVGLPTPSPGHSHCLNRRLSRAVPIGILMEIRLQQRLQVPLDNHLGNPIRYRRDAQRPLAPTFLRNLHHPHRRRKITPRRHPIPELIEILLKILLKILYRLPVYSRSSLVRSYPLECLPNYPLRDPERFRFTQRLLLRYPELTTR